MEAYQVSGPAKNLIRFARASRAARNDGLRSADVSITTFVRGQTTDNAFIRAVRGADLKIDVIPEQYPFDVSVVAHLRRILNDHGPHIIQTHGIKAHFLVWAARLNKHRRWIAYHHGYTTENVRMRLYNQLNRITLPAADQVVTVCRPFAEALERTGVQRSRILVLPNSVEEPPPIDPSQLAELRRSLHLRPDERTIVTIGRLSSEKGHMDLIAAIAKLRPAGVRLVIVGEGIERPALERAIAAEGLQQHVLLAGHSQQVAAYYALADLFVLPSYSEGSPNVILEAMAAGLPIVATNVGGVPELLTQDHSGILVPPHDPAGLAAGMARILNDPALAGRLQHAAREAARGFSPATYQQALLSLYQDLCPR
jgi:glycosyltransferase involved in cell wall biosynthesis